MVDCYTTHRVLFILETPLLVAFVYMLALFVLGNGDVVCRVSSSAIVSGPLERTAHWKLVWKPGVYYSFRTPSMKTSGIWVLGSFYDKLHYTIYESRNHPRPRYHHVQKPRAYMLTDMHAYLVFVRTAIQVIVDLPKHTKPLSFFPCIFLIPCQVPSKGETHPDFSANRTVSEYLSLLYTQNPSFLSWFQFIESFRKSASHNLGTWRRNQAYVHMPAHRTCKHLFKQQDRSLCGHQ